MGFHARVAAPVGGVDTTEIAAAAAEAAQGRGDKGGLPIVGVQHPLLSLSRTSPAEEGGVLSSLVQTYVLLLCSLFFEVLCEAMERKQKH